MSIITTKKDVVWNYLATILNVSISIVILPVILLKLSTQDVAIWYVFGSVAALVSLLDFGFSPTIMRNVTYAWNGANEISEKGIPTIFSFKVNNELLSLILSSSKKIYDIISYMGLTILIILGTFYIYTITDKQFDHYVISWIVFSLAVFLNLKYAYWNPFLKGIGAIKESNQIIVIVRVIYLILTFAGLYYGLGILWLSIMYMLSGILIRIISKKVFLSKTKECDLDEKTTQNKGYNLFSLIWPNAKKQGLVAIASWATTRSSIILSSLFVDLETTAQLGLSIQLLSVVGGLSAILFNTYLPEITSLKVSNNHMRFNEKVKKALKSQWILGAIGICGILFVVPYVLKLLNSNSQILESKYLIFLCLLMFLEWNQLTFCTLITVSNEIPYVKSSLITSISIIVTSITILSFTEYGIMAIILIQLLGQSIYNNWRWPLYAIQENSIAFKINLKKG